MDFGHSCGNRVHLCDSSDRSFQTEINIPTYGLRVITLCRDAHTRRRGERKKCPRKKKNPTEIKFHASAIELFYTILLIVV